MPIPMLADFAARLAWGMAAMLLVTSWRAVPPTFFRTHCQVMLGLLVLAALDISRVGLSGLFIATTVAAAFAFFASVAWGLGLPRVGVPLTAALALAAAGTLLACSRSLDGAIWGLNASGRLASALLMGSTLTAMLLGHHYLTAPAMSIEPLQRFVRAMAWSLGLRVVVAGLGLWSWNAGRGGTGGSAPDVSLFLVVRWGVGFLGTLVAVLLAWQTVKLRSTQSATGILYIAMTLVLFGELTALILSRGTDVIF
jgi:hypothetical protein